MWLLALAALAPASTQQVDDQLARTPGSDGRTRAVSVVENQDTQREQGRERAKHLLHRLELGRSAAAELDDHETVERLERLMRAVRERMLPGRRRQEAGEEPERRDVDEHRPEHAVGEYDFDLPDLEQRETRVKLLGLVARALQRAGDEEAAGEALRLIHVGRLELSGAGPDELGRAAEGLSVELIVELCERAERLYGAWGQERESALCEALWSHYEERLSWGGEREEGREHERAQRRDERSSRPKEGRGARRGRDARRGGAEHLERLERHVEELQRELRELRSLVKRRLRDRR